MKPYHNSSTFLDFKTKYTFNKALLLPIPFFLCFSLQSNASLINQENNLSAPSDSEIQTIQSDLPAKNLSEQFFQQLNTLDSSTSEAQSLAQKGYNQIQNGNIENGLASLSKARAMDPALIFPGAFITLIYLKTKNYKKALDSALQLQQTHPKDPVGFSLEGVSHAAMEQPGKSKISFKKAYTLSPGDINSGVNLARYAIIDKKYDKARNFYQQILEQNPDSFQTIILLAKLELQLGKARQAVELLENKLTVYPQASLIREFLMRIYYTLGKYQSVLGLSQALTEQDIDRQPSLLEFRGKAQMQIGDIKAAINSFKQLVFKLPDSAQAHFILTNAYYLNNNLAEALKETEQSIKLNADYLPALVAQIKLLALNNKEKQASEKLIALQQNYKESLSVNEISAWLAMHQANYTEAEKYYAIIAKQAPSSANIKSLFISIWSQKRFDDAFNVLEEWLAKQPNDILIRSLLSDTYMLSNRKKEAIASYHKLIQIAPDSTQGYNNLALLLQEKNLKKALIMAQKAHQLDNNNASIKDTLAKLLIADQQLNKGLLLLKEAVKSAPQDFTIQFHYAEALLKVGKQNEAQKQLKNIIHSSSNKAIKTRAQTLLNIIN